MFPMKSFARKELIDSKMHSCFRAYMTQWSYESVWLKNRAPFVRGNLGKANEDQSPKKSGIIF